MLSTKDIAAEIATELSNGYGFVALVGAGLSASAGIPVVAGLKTYIQQRIAHALGLNLWSSDLALTTPWNPKLATWPPIAPSLSDGGVPKRLQQVIAKSESDPKWREDLPAPVGTYQEAYGAMADWRAGLQFLSRIETTRAWRSDRPTVTCGPPDHDVIDSFFLHVVANRQPALAHRLLVMLSDVLRMRTLLTTNFDSLLEDAFALRGDVITLFDVHQLASLPPSRLVLRQRSLVKLHGGRYGLRADYSLDKPLSEVERRHFLGYIDGQEIPDDLSSEPNRTQPTWPNQLLVAGLSGTDRRIRDLIHTALNTLPNLRVFWICYDNEARAAVQRSFHTVTHRFSISVQASLGLFFLELYQRISKSVPPSGIDFPATWQHPVPPGPSLPNERDSEMMNEFRCYYARLEQALRKADTEATPRGILLESSIEVPGAVSVGIHLFEAYQSQRPCVWLELDNILDVDELFIRLYEAMARRKGHQEDIPFRVLSASDHALREWRDAFQRLLVGSDDRWLVFINAREVPGANISSTHAHSTTPQVDRADAGVFHDARWGRDPSEIARFWTLVEALCVRDTGPVVTVVLLRHTHKDSQNVLGTIPEHPPFIQVCPPAGPCVSFDQERAIARTIEWLESGVGPVHKPFTRRFVYSLTLFHRARYIASLATWAVYRVEVDLNADHDDVRADVAGRWLDILHGFGVVRYKRGGFVWIHHGLRESLRNRLEDVFGEELRPQAAEIHESIADWYDRLYLASRDPLAVLESIDHRIQCTLLERASVWHQRPNMMPSDGKRREARILGSIRQAINSLALGRESILSHNHAHTLSRRLARLRDALPTSLGRGASHHESGPVSADERVLDADREFRLMCSHVLALLAREASEFVTAYGFITDWKQERRAEGSASASSRRPNASDRPPIEEASDSEVVLLIKKRALQGAEERLRDSLKQAKLLPWEATTIRHARDNAAIWAASTPSQATIRRALTLCRRYMEVSLMRGYALQLNERRGDAGASAHASIVLASKLYFSALEALRFLRDEGDGTIQKEQCWIKLQLAVGLSMSGAITEAHRRLNEAEAFLGSSPRRAAGLHAMLDIRRAEFFLERARGLPGFADQRRHLALALQDAQPLSKWVGARVALALAGDAESALMRAASNLSRSRRSVWWWSLWLEMRMKTTETRLVATSGDDDIVLSVKDTMDSLATILEDIRRVTRDDSFRFARVLQSYVTCLRALAIKAKLTRVSDLGEIKRGAVAARDALRELSQVHEARAKMKPELDGPTSSWIRYVLDRSSTYIELVERRLGWVPGSDAQH